MVNSRQETRPPSLFSSTSPLWPWLLAGGLMLAEFLLFDLMTSQHHASIYPRWNDQIQYLTESYRAYDAAKVDGLWAGLKNIGANPASQGTVHDVLAMLVFLLVGSASRSAALSLNMLAFHFLTWKSVSRWDHHAPPPLAAKLAGGLSLMLWVGVIACGRWIAFSHGG